MILLRVVKKVGNKWGSPLCPSSRSSYRYFELSALGFAHKLSIIFQILFVSFNKLEGTKSKFRVGVEMAFVVQLQKYVVWR